MQLIRTTILFDPMGNHWKLARHLAVASSERSGLFRERNRMAFSPLPVLQSTVSAKHPNICPNCFPSLMANQFAEPYFKLLWCHATDCIVCRRYRLEWKIQKVKDGLVRSVLWQHTILDCDHPDFMNKRRWILAQLNRLGWMYASVTVKTDKKRLHIFHEPIPGWRPNGAVVLGRKKTLLAISRIIRADSSLAVRFARASKSRPCWTKNTVEKRRANDKRNPEQKHRLIVSSQLGQQRFQRLCVDQIGRTLSNGDKLRPMEAKAVFTTNRLPSNSETAVGCSLSYTARFIQSERDEKRWERESWYSSGPE